MLESVTNLFVCGWIVSATGKFSCNIKGPSSMLQPYLTGVPIIHTYVSNVGKLWNKHWKWKTCNLVRILAGMRQNRWLFTKSGQYVKMLSWSHGKWILFFTCEGQSWQNELIMPVGKCLPARTRWKTNLYGHVHILTVQATLDCSNAAHTYHV